MTTPRKPLTPFLVPGLAAEEAHAAIGRARDAGTGIVRVTPAPGTSPFASASNPRPAGPSVPRTAS